MEDKELAKGYKLREEMMDLKERIAGGFMYPKALRSQMLISLYKEFEEKKVEYEALREEYYKKNPTLINE